MTKSIPDGTMPKFKTERELALYTKERYEELSYPRATKEKGDMLGCLLRHIDDIDPTACHGRGIRSESYHPRENYWD